MNKSLHNIFNDLFKPFKSLVVRRFSAFIIDISILLVMALLIAFLAFTFNTLKGVYIYYLVFYLGYFFIVRFSLNGDTIGMKVTRINLCINDNYSFKSLRIIYRIILNFTFLFLCLNFYPILSYIFPVINYGIKIKMLVLVALLSIPLVNLILIIQTKGSTSLIDIFSKCSIKTRNINEESSTTSTLSFRKIASEFLIVISIIYLLALLVFWKFQPERIFTNQVLSPLIENPIEKFNLQDYLSKYSENNSPIMAYVSEDYNFLSPYQFIKGKDTFVFYVFFKRELFNDKDQHSLFINEALYIKSYYELFYQKKIEQCKVIIRKYGFFPPFTFISDYKYLAIGEGKNYVISGDLADDVKKKKREEYFAKIKKLAIGDTLKMELSYPSFSETKSSLNLLFNVSTGLLKSPGINFYFVGNKFEEFGQL